MQQTEASCALHWVNGNWLDSEQHGESINPATGKKIGDYAIGDMNTARAAVTAASYAFNHTNWKHDRERRALVLHDLADRFEANAEKLAQLLSLENGKILPEARFEISLVAPGLRYCAGLVFQDGGRAAQWGNGRFSLVIREPVGVAGISVPWNSPVALLSRSLAPALAAGCTVVIKMPGQTAQVNALIARIISSSPLLPKGVVNMVTGEKDVLSFLVESPDVPVISFTGSTRTGRAIQAAGAACLKRFGLELGGKTPIIIFDDADLDAALLKTEKALTTFAGQFCMTGSRLLVQRGVANRVRERLIARLSTLKVGPASEAFSEMGPLIDKDNVERVDVMVERALQDGAVALVRGGPVREGPLASGAFYLPTFLEVDSSALAIVQEEVFGPVLTLQVFDTEEEAVALANQSEYGLAASIWSSDLNCPLRVAAHIDAGTVWINDWATIRDEFEEGGYKQSGQGRLRGLAQLDDFVEYKHIVLQPGAMSQKETEVENEHQ
ncbi:aldehyde dehydrogenase family protein [Enterobacter sp. RHBSTW-00994]|uniref:aldehyde dehydrogenase family protein n=1 Tax=Enterobacter sp. RHBSTW-00994 TaxID=2742676 RepID=UPI0020182167|nr:aldehyde dehydrogenase family protein [Enterobacter sp. RHBSTW-00994]